MNLKEVLITASAFGALVVVSAAVTNMAVKDGDSRLGAASSIGSESALEAGGLTGDGSKIYSLDDASDACRQRLVTQIKHKIVELSFDEENSNYRNNDNSHVVVFAVASENKGEIERSRIQCQVSAQNNALLQLQIQSTD